ncbi:MAG TPA: DUF3658 domain-containing protein, partial [Stellaceae bacterium]|nr:DUF3658 domain-containing protein [Stellaceae bacterium]
MSGGTIHVVVGESAGGVLRQALRSIGRDDRIVALADDLSVGPINPAEPRARAAWATRELGFNSGEAIVRRVENSWSEALVPASRRVVWTSRRSGCDYAGFLEWLWRLRDDPCEVIDLTDLRFPDRCAEGPAGYLSLVISLGTMNPDQIMAMGLLDRAVPLTPATRSQYREIWRKLRVENAPLRVVSEAGLTSAPITFYDGELLSFAVGHWRKVARIVGEALSNQEGFARCGDLLLAARVRALG